MNIKELRNYNNWIGQSADVIRNNVILNGGWVRVFPASQEFPIWVSRVRNYFNEYPQELKRLSNRKGNNMAHNVNNYRQFGFADSFFMQQALSRDVYIDQNGRLWYQMSTAGAGYHYENRTSFEKLTPNAKALKNKISPQSQVPVFKLISPDGTGGSLEVCIHNFQVYQNKKLALLGLITGITEGTGGEPEIGSVDEWVNVRASIVQNKVYKGSYNFSETVQMGFSAHDHRDIIPHKKAPNRYVDPHRWSILAHRIFPPTDKGKPISFQPAHV